MKSLIIFYTTCIIALYSLLICVGYRNDKVGKIKSGFLAEVVVTATNCNTNESNILAGHFDKAICYMETKQEKRAAKEVYDGLMVLTMRTVSLGDYDKKMFRSTITDLKNCYLDMERSKHVSLQRVDKVFENSELFAAQSYILKSQKDIKKNNLSKALKDINQAEECITTAVKYADAKNKELDKKIFKGSRHFLNDVIIEMNSRGQTSWKQTKRKFYSMDDRLEGSVSL